MGSTACSSTGRTKHDVSLQKQVQITALDISFDFPGEIRIGLGAETYTSNDEDRMLNAEEEKGFPFIVQHPAFYVILTTDYFLPV
jgi:hypothetical protein